MTPTQGIHIGMNRVHDERGLQQIDLNLLVALDSLIRERSVTRAAEKSGVTQSAMSHTLRRLRELFGDPLLVRGRGGMVPTPRAEALVVPLRSGLLSLRRAMEQPEVFAPASARRTFQVASPDLFDVLALPSLIQRLGREAPGVDMAIVPQPRDLAVALETGDVDAAVVPVLLGDTQFAPEVDADLQRRTLFKDRFGCFVRTGHPVTRGRARLTLKRYCALPHILVSPGGGGRGPVDAALAAQTMSRRVALRVPQFASALAIASHTDLVLTAPRSLEIVAGESLVPLPLPFDFPAHAVTLVWHRRFSRDPAHEWFRGLMADVVQELLQRHPGCD